MTLILIGASFRSIPLSELEILERNAELIRNAIFENYIDGSDIEGGVVVSTCNRFEIYLDAGDSDLARNRVFQAISSSCELDIAYCEENLITLCGVEAIAHLFQVSAGLDSMVVGESEITGQIKRALAQTQRMGYSSRVIEALFQRASTVSKRVVNETGLGAAGRSLITSALEIVKSAEFTLSGKTILVIGTGAYARVVITALNRENVGTIFVYSPSGRAEEFSETHPTTPILDSQFPQVLTEVDLIVACSGTHGRLVTSEQLIHSEKKYLPIIDLSLSPDIEENVKKLANVQVIDLEMIYRSAPQEHLEVIARADKLTTQAALELELDLAARANDPLVMALRAHVNTIVTDEVDRVRRKKGEEIAQEVNRSLQLVTKSIFHKPTIHARSSAILGESDEYQRAIQILFGLEVEEDKESE